MPETRREFSREFKRETVVLLESSGRPLMRVATGVGICIDAAELAAAVRGGSARSWAGPPPGSPPLPSPADQASEIRWPVGRMCRVLEVSAMRDHMRTEPPLAALMMAARRQRPAEGLICHSDRVADTRPRHTASNSLQRRWATREDARRDPFAQIEGYHNRRRIHSALGYRTPEQAERHMA